MSDNFSNFTDLHWDEALKWMEKFRKIAPERLKISNHTKTSLIGDFSSFTTRFGQTKKKRVYQSQKTIFYNSLIITKMERELETRTSHSLISCPKTSRYASTTIQNFSLSTEIICHTISLQLSLKLKLDNVL